MAKNTLVKDLPVFELIAANNNIKGNLASFQAGDGLLILELVGGIEVSVRGLDNNFLESLVKMGLARLKTASIDLNRFRVTIRLTQKTPPPPPLQKSNSREFKIAMG